MSTQTAGASGIDRYFKITERGSTVEREIRGGVVTFFTMAYIVVLNPLILGFAQDADGEFLGGGAAPNLPAIAAGTALVAGVMTILMGVVGQLSAGARDGARAQRVRRVLDRQPDDLGRRDGTGRHRGRDHPVLVLTGFRTAVFHAIPTQLKVAISVGIGLFIALIGFVDAGFVHRIPDAANSTVPVQLGPSGELIGWPVRGLRARAGPDGRAVGPQGQGRDPDLDRGHDDPGDHRRGDRRAPRSWSLTVPDLPGFGDLAEKPDFGTLGEFSLLGSFEEVGVVAALLLVFTLLLADFFDTMGTMTAIGAEAGLLDEEGIPPNTERILIVDSVAAAAGGLGGVSSNTSYIESASGVGEGARTGLASVVTGVLFLITILLAPLVAVIPSEAAVPALVLVGFLMMQQVRDDRPGRPEIAIPAFLTIVLMPFTYSITVGIGAGFIAYAFIKVVKGKAREVHPLLWVVAAMFIVYFAIDPITDLLT